MAHQISTGVLRDVYTSQHQGDPFTIQIIDMRKIMAKSNTTGDPVERYRMVISDSQWHCQAVLATQISDFIVSKNVEKLSLIKISQCICNASGPKRIVVIIQAEIVGGPLPSIVGEPVNLEEQGGPPQFAKNQGQQGQQQARPNAGNNNYQQQQQQQQQQPNVKPEPNGGQGWQTGQQPFSNGAMQQQNSYNGHQQNQGQQGYNSNSANANVNGNMYGGNNGNSGGFGGGGGGGGGNFNQGGGGGGGNFNQGGGGGGGNFNQGGGGGPSFQQSGGGFGGGGGGGVQNRGILQMDDNTANITPISGLTPYSGKWTIQVRLTVKGAMRHYKNAKGEGRLFSVDLMDNTCDIRGTFFNDDADRWMDELQPNKVYRVKGGNLKPANKQFTTTKSEYEITFGRDTVFEPVAESLAPKVTYNIVPIDQIEQTDPQNIVDVCGIIQAVDPISEITVKTGSNAGNKIPKRDVTIVDSTSKQIRLTLWDQHKDLVDEHDASHPVIAVKNCRVSDFNGRSLSTTRSSMVELNPDMHQAHALRGWYDMQGGQANFTSISSGGGGMRDPRKTVSDIKDGGLGQGEKPDFFTLRGWVTFIKKDGTWQYPANPANKKKVVEQGDQWVDESTGTILEQPERRYILSFLACDQTGSQWLSAFNDQAITLMGGKTADELWNIQNNEQSEFETCFQKCFFKAYIFKVRAKSEQWNDESRVKCVVQDCKPLNFKEGSAELLAAIREYGV